MSFHLLKVDVLIAPFEICLMLRCVDFSSELKLFPETVLAAPVFECFSVHLEACLACAHSVCLCSLFSRAEKEVCMGFACLALCCSLGWSWQCLGCIEYVVFACRFFIMLCFALDHIC